MSRVGRKRRVLLDALAMSLANDSEIYNCYGEDFGNFESAGLNVAFGQFDHASFSDIKFIEGEFSSASFDNATLDKVTFIDCDLTGADFSNAELTDVSFVSCILARTNFDCATLTNLSVTGSEGELELKEAVISKGVFYQVEMAGSSIFNTELDAVVFCDCDLSGIFVSKGTNMIDVKITHSDITNFPISFARNGNAVKLHKCTYRPYVSSKKTERRMPPPITPHYTTTPSTATYFPRDSKAVLYCSCFEEYGEAS